MSAMGQKRTHALQQTIAYSMTSLARVSSMSPVAICTAWTALRN
jgi:hypothetical protein